MLNVKVKGVVVKKVLSVTLRRLADGSIFRITAPCVLRLPKGLVHVTGSPQEELDTDIWDTTQKFEVIDLKNELNAIRTRKYDHWNFSA